LVDIKLLTINPGTWLEIFYRSGDKHASRHGLMHYARAGMERDAADIVADQFVSTGVHSRTYFDTKLSDRERNCDRATHRSRGTIERRQKTVAGSVGFLPAETRQFLSHNGVVRVQKIAPGRVPKLGCALGGRGNIEEEHGGQDTIGGIDRALARNEFLNI